MSHYLLEIGSHYVEAVFLGVVEACECADDMLLVPVHAEAFTCAMSRHAAKSSLILLHFGTLFLCGIEADV